MNLLNKIPLKIDWATHEAARFACENWHYSKTIPSGKMNRFGVWEDGNFKGVILYGRPAFPSIGKPFGLDQTQIVELVRVALTKHKAEVSKIIAISLRLLKKHNPKLQMVVSFADQGQNHHGGIYQASNWIYIGSGGAHIQYTLDGKIIHQRTLVHRFGIKFSKNPRIKKYTPAKKHKYIMPLDDSMRKKVESLKKPYPKCVSSADSGTLGFQSRGGGANPTDTLHFQNAK